MLTASGRIDTGDGQAFFDVSLSLFEDLDVALPPPDPNRIAMDARGRPLGKSEELGIEDGYRTQGRGGLYYSPTGIGASLLILPFLALGHLIASGVQAGSPYWTMEFVATMLFNPLVSASSGLLVYLVCRRLVFTKRQSVAVALIYAFGTMTWVSAKSFFSDPLVALALILTFYGVISYRSSRQQRWLWLAGASLGLAVLTKPTSLLNIPLFVIYLWLVLWSEPWPLRWQSLVAFGLPLTLGLAGMLAYNWWRFESPTNIGYGNQSWSVPFLTGFYGLTLSPGKGYLFYNPITLGAIIGSIAFWHRNRWELGLIIGLVATNLIFLAKFESWDAGGCWGPRYLLQITPLIVLPLACLFEDLPQKKALNMLLAALIAVSIIVQIPGVFVNFGRYLQRVHNLSVEQYYDRVTFQIAYSPLIGQWGEMREVIGNLRDPAQRAEILQIAFQNNSDKSEAVKVLSANLPDFWFVYVSLIGL
jgi:hypothetical protein